MPPAPLALWRVAAPFVALLALIIVCRLRPVPLLQVVLRVCLAFVGYGMLQDQASARLCPEYFTIGHAPIPGLADPTLLGLAWGVLSGLPGGIVLGVLAALAARSGPWPPLEAASLRRPLLALVGALAAGTLIAGGSAAYNADVIDIALGEPWAALIPPERQRWFFIVASAHFGTYLSGTLGGLGMLGWIAAARRAAAKGARDGAAGGH